MLADIDRESGFVRFSRVTEGPRYDLIYWMDDSGSFRVTSVDAQLFYGQVRLRTVASTCALPKGDVDGCKSGTADKCMEEARSSMKNQNPAEALDLFKAACEKGAVDGCDAAARLYSSSGLPEKAKAMKDLAEILRKRTP